MRQTCQLSYTNVDGERIVCGKPAVDFVVRPDLIDPLVESKFWLCARHFDTLTRFREILARPE